MGLWYQLGSDSLQLLNPFLEPTEAGSDSGNFSFMTVNKQHKPVQLIVNPILYGLDPRHPS